MPSSEKVYRYGIENEDARSGWPYRLRYHEYDLLWYRVFVHVVQSRLTFGFVYYTRYETFANLSAVPRCAPLMATNRSALTAVPVGWLRLGL